MSRDADFGDAVAIDVVHDVEGVENDGFRRIGLPDTARLVETALISE
jgi:hypothetical protein